MFVKLFCAGFGLALCLISVVAHRARVGVRPWNRLETDMRAGIVGTRASMYLDLGTASLGLLVAVGCFSPVAAYEVLGMLLVAVSLVKMVTGFKQWVTGSGQLRLFGINVLVPTKAWYAPLASTIGQPTLLLGIVIIAPVWNWVDAVAWIVFVGYVGKMYRDYFAKPIAQA